MDENNKELNVNNNGVNPSSDINNINNASVSNDSVSATNAEVINNVSTNEGVIEVTNTTNTVVEEVSFNYPEEGSVQTVENTSVVNDTNVVNDTVVPSASVTTTIEEVSVSGTSLDEVETSSDSVFNESNKEEVVSGSMKEGQEHRADKKGIPYGMLIGFGILIICAFFIEEIVGFVEDYLLPNDEIVEETKKDDKEENNTKEDKDEDKVNDTIPDNDNNENDNENNDIVDSDDNSNDLEDDNNTDNVVDDNSFNEGQ